MTLKWPVERHLGDVWDLLGSSASRVIVVVVGVVLIVDIIVGWLWRAL